MGHADEQKLRQARASPWPQAASGYCWLCRKKYMYQRHDKPLTQKLTTQGDQPILQQTFHVL